MRYRILLLAIIMTVPTAAAQIVVHPNPYATQEGTGNNWYPYRYNNSAGHYQQSYDASQFNVPLTISEISFRYMGDRVKPTVTADFKMTLAYCSTAWNALSTTFASNIGSGTTVVFDGIWNIPAFGGDPATPNPFTARLTLTTPFAYDPSQGDLIMDVEMRQSTVPSSGGAFAIAHASVGVNRVYADTGNPGEPIGSIGSSGLITEFSGPPCNGTVVSAGLGCRDSSQTRLAMYYLGCPDLGANLMIGTTTGASVTAPVFLVMGLSDQFWVGIALPVDLTLFGAPGCSIYTSQQLVATFPNPGGGASMQITVPTDTHLIGAITYWQGYVLELGLNPLNVASSNYLAVTIG